MSTHSGLGSTGQALTLRGGGGGQKERAGFDSGSCERERAADAERGGGSYAGTGIRWRPPPRADVRPAVSYRYLHSVRCNQLIGRGQRERNGGNRRAYARHRKGGDDAAGGLGRHFGAGRGPGFGSGRGTGRHRLPGLWESACGWWKWEGSSD